MTHKSLQSQIALGEDSKRQFKVDACNAESLAAEMAAFANSEGGQMFLGVSYVAKGLLPYHGLGSGIKRALEQWPQIEFADDHDGCLFRVTVPRKPIEVLDLVESGADRFQKNWPLGNHRMKKS